ncbi:MAG: ATP-binding protein [Sphingomonadales bacterium]|nr:ATP-binding protein [Sphingomonadales bacterium]
MVKRTLNEILPLSQLVFVIGNYLSLHHDKININKTLFLAESGSGKSTFLNTLIQQAQPSKLSHNLGFNKRLNMLFSDIALFIQTKDEQDFNLINKKIKFLSSDFNVTEKDFLALPNDSIVILDDFSLQNTKQNKTEFLKVINYYLRHHNITLFLVIHNIYSTGLMNEILIAPHVILAYSNLGYYILR